MPMLYSLALIQYKHMQSMDYCVTNTAVAHMMVNMLQNARAYTLDVRTCRIRCMNKSGEKTLFCSLLNYIAPIYSTFHTNI